MIGIGSMCFNLPVVFNADLEEKIAKIERKLLMQLAHMYYTIHQRFCCATHEVCASLAVSGKGKSSHCWNEHIPFEKVFRRYKTKKSNFWDSKWKSVFCTLVLQALILHILSNERLCFVAATARLQPDWKLTKIWEIIFDQMRNRGFFRPRVSLKTPKSMRN